MPGFGYVCQLNFEDCPGDDSVYAEAQFTHSCTDRLLPSRLEAKARIGVERRYRSCVVFNATSEKIERTEARLEDMENAFREHFQSGIAVPVADEEGASEAFEVATFSFGLMAGIMRSANALVVLCRVGLNVEATPILRSMLDSIIALYSVKQLGVHAVHAYGKELAFNYKRLKHASNAGFRLGESDAQYIDKFIALAASLPESPAGKRAENSIKTYQAAQEEGDLALAVYQMWLFATPLSKPSMRLSDAYLELQATPGSARMALRFESDPSSVVDPRILASTVIPLALIALAQIVGDTDFEGIATTFAENLQI